VYVNRIDTGLLKQIEQYQRDRHRLNEIAVGADSLFQHSIASSAHPDLGCQPSLANAHVQDDQQEAAQPGIQSCNHESLL
jgi:hypothetical protein